MNIYKIISFNKMESIVAKSRKIAYAWEQYYIRQLPDYAFAYDDGMKYITSHHMIPIENKVKQIYIASLENGGEYPLPPT